MVTAPRGPFPPSPLGALAAFLVSLGRLVSSGSPFPSACSPLGPSLMRSGVSLLFAWPTSVSPGDWILCPLVPESHQNPYFLLPGLTHTLG